MQKHRTNPTGVRVEQPIDSPGTSPFKRVPTLTHQAPKSVTFDDPTSTNEAKTESVPMSDLIAAGVMDAPPWASTPSTTQGDAMANADAPAGGHGAFAAPPPELSSIDGSAVSIEDEDGMAAAAESFPEFDSVPDETTSPGMRPAALAAAEAVEAKRGEIAQLLNAIAPFLWSLEEAAKWTKEIAEGGNTSAAQHARSLSLLAKILGQLQARIDELQKLG